jgi:metal-dependent hydrolase (beta-lactamase superfamily II)
MEGGRTYESPLAQRGFSALVTLTVGGQTHYLLFDTDTTPDALIANMHTLDIAPKDIETIILSHGRFDHATGLDGRARTLGRTNLPVMMHPRLLESSPYRHPGARPFRASDDEQVCIARSGASNFLSSGIRQETM